MITAADEQAIRKLPRQAWQAAVDQDGKAQKDTTVAEITRLMSRAGTWPQGLRWIVRRTRPSRRQMPNLTALEKATGWRYSIIVTNIAGTGIGNVPGSHHPQFIDVLHREHAVVEDRVRTQRAMGLRNLRLWHLPARLTSHPVPTTREGAAPARSEPVPPRAHRAAPPPVNQISQPKTGTTRSVTNLARTLNHRG